MGAADIFENLVEHQAVRPKLKAHLGAEAEVEEPVVHDHPVVGQDGKERVRIYHDTINHVPCAVVTDVILISRNLVVGSSETHRQFIADRYSHR